jgi:hypothetical protein
MTRVKGHTLANEGAAFDNDGNRITFGHRILGSSGEGHPKCSCGALGPWLDSGRQRRVWHRLHKQHVSGQAS